MPATERPGRLSPTGPGHLGLATLCGALVAGILLGGLGRAGIAAPLTPWLFTVLLGLCTVVLTMWARAMARAVRHHRDEIDPDGALVALACAKVAMLAGAALAGFHIVYVLVFVRNLNIPLPRERVIWGSAAIVVSVALACAGKLLEKACTTPAAGAGSGEDGGEMNDSAPLD